MVRDQTPGERTTGSSGGVAGSWLMSWRGRRGGVRVCVSLWRRGGRGLKGGKGNEGKKE